jgi:hypothetical protein
MMINGVGNVYERKTNGNKEMEGKEVERIGGEEVVLA